MPAVVVWKQSNHIVVFCPISAPQWPSGSGFRSGLWTHLRLLQHAVFESTHQKQHWLSLPGKMLSSSHGQQFKKNKQPNLLISFSSSHPNPCLRPLVPACCRQSLVWLLALLCLASWRDSGSKVRESPSPGGLITISSLNGKGEAQRTRSTRQHRRGAMISRNSSLVSFLELVHKCMHLHLVINLCLTLHSILSPLFRGHWRRGLRTCGPYRSGVLALYEVRSSL